MTLEQSSMALSELPSHMVRPLTSIRVDQLRHWADQAQQHFVFADLSATRDKKTLLLALAKALALPDWFGCNLDALYDSLTDMSTDQAQRGFVIVLENLPNAAHFNAEQRAELLDVFRDAAEYYSDQHTPFRVFYS